MSLFAAFAGSLLAAATPVYARIEPLEIRTGVMRLRTVEAPFLEVPVIGADPFRWSEERFARLYSIEYELETRRPGEPPVLETRGTFLAAVRMGSEALQALEERVRDHVATLKADDFLAFIPDAAAPFDQLAALEDGKSWTCTIQPREPNRATIYRPGIAFEGGTLTSKGFTGEVPDRLCPAMVAAATGLPEEFRTLPVPLAVRETVIEAEASERLPGEIRADELAPLPEGAQFFKLSTQDGHSYFFGPEEGGMVPRATYAVGGTAWVAITVPASLSTEALAGKAYVSRWTLREVERRLGTEPQETVRANAAVTLAILPVAPPGVKGQPATAPSGPVSVNFDDATLRKEVLGRIEGESALDVAKLEVYLTHGYGIWNEGFLLAVCRPDGTAWFGLLPTHSRNRVTNASAVCATMERRLR